VANPFKRASKTQLKLRMALIGPAGSGKTYTALNIGQHLGEKVAVVDTEHGSASKYADLFTFDVLELESFHPQMYIDAIAAAEQAGYEVLIIDSLSHAWIGKDGALELVDKAAKRSRSGNSFAAWRDVTPLHNNLVEAMLAARLHLIVTMRSKMEYVQEKDEKGRTQIRKVGLQPVQRDGLEYEFDVVADLDTDNNLIIGKTRCPQLTGVVLPRPGRDIADMLNAWLTNGRPPAETPKSTLQPKFSSTSAPRAVLKPQTISAELRRNLFATSRAAFIPDEMLQAETQRRFGKSRSADLTMPEYEELMTWIAEVAMQDSLAEEQGQSVAQETASAADIVVPFGKHRGKTLAEIQQIQPEYLAYLAQKAGNEQVKAGAAALLVQESQLITESQTAQPSQADDQQTFGDMVGSAPF
jgi:hypothetical protein